MKEKKEERKQRKERKEERKEVRKKGRKTMSSENYNFNVIKVNNKSRMSQSVEVLILLLYF